MPADCRRCRHHYITWDPAHPHGCRAMGFKGCRLPVEVVRRSTPGLDCQRFEPRPAVAGRSAPGLDRRRLEPRRPRRK